MFGKLLSAVIDVAKLPVDAVVDVVTMGEGLDERGSQTLRRIDKIQEKLEDIDK